LLQFSYVFLCCKEFHLILKYSPWSLVTSYNRLAMPIPMINNITVAFLVLGSSSFCVDCRLFVFGWHWEHLKKKSLKAFEEIYFICFPTEVKLLNSFWQICIDCFACQGALNQNWLASILSGEHNLAAMQCTHSKIPLQAVNKLVKLLFRKRLDRLTFGSSAFVLCNIQQNQTINKPCTHYCHYLSLSLSLSLPHCSCYQQWFSLLEEWQCCCSWYWLLAKYASKWNCWCHRHLLVWLGTLGQIFLASIRWR